MMEMVLVADSQLTPGDIDFVEGKDEKLVRKLAKKLNRSYEQIIGWLESLSSTAVRAAKNKYHFYY